MTHLFPVGIDLGTTNSAASYVTQAGRTTMVRNELGDILTPSCVFFDDDATVVGRDAKKALAFARNRVVCNAKRDLGDRHTSDRVLGRDMPPEAIEAIILNALGQDIHRELAESQVVITVPAFFNEQRRSLTLAAGEIAGLRVLDLVNEPTAAALAFGEQLGYLTPDGRPREGLNLMVYDLGGGTFDVTILQLAQGVVRTLATDGDYKLGGIDWDQRLVDYVAQKFEDEFRDDFRDESESLTKVTQACEAAKHTLSSRQRAVVPVDYHDHHLDVTITRATFEQLTEDLVERTAITARHAIEAASLKWPSIHRVLLVGGSTRMPMVARRVIEMVGRPPDEAVNPDEAVARGAAIYAASVMQSRGLGETALDLRVVDVNSHSLGVAGIDQATRRVCNKILIPRNTPLPARVTYKFVTKEADQKSVAIKVLEGETADLDGCWLLGKAVLRELPPDLRKGHPIDVIYHCQENGRVEVTARVADTDHAITVQFERERLMPPGDLRAWREAVVGGVAFENLESLLLRLESDQEGITEGWQGKGSASGDEIAVEIHSREMDSDGVLSSERVESARFPNRYDVSPIWVFAGAIVGAMLLILLVRLGLGR